MEGQWTKATVVNKNIAAGRVSPIKATVNGIQGNHSLPMNMSGSPQSRRAAEGGLRNSMQPRTNIIAHNLYNNQPAD